MQNTRGHIMVKKIFITFLIITILFINSASTILALSDLPNIVDKKENNSVKISALTAPLPDDIPLTNGIKLVKTVNGNNNNETSGTYTLLANRTYCIAIAGAAGADSTYGGGNGGVQHLKITVGTSNVTLKYKVGGKANGTTPGWPDGKNGEQASGGGSTSIYINDILAASAGGGAGGTSDNAGEGGTYTGGTGTDNSGYTATSIAGCTLAILDTSVNGSTGRIEGESDSVYYSRMSGNPGNGFFKLYEYSYKAKFSITVEDSITNEKLSGVIFGLFEYNGQEYTRIGQLKESTKGVYVSSELEYTQTNLGKFKIVQEQAPTNYYNYGWSKEITINASGTTTISETIKNEPYRKIKFNIKNVDSISKEALSGATFGIYEYRETDFVKIGQLKENTPGTYTSDEIQSTNTTAKFKVVQETVPNMYEASNWSKEITLNTAGVTTVSETVNNEPYKIKAKTTKVDSETNNSLAGATFTVYSWNIAQNNYQPYIRNGSNVTLVRQNDGTYITNEWLYYSIHNQGKFRIIETTAPNGYVGDFTNIENLEKRVYDFEISTSNNNSTITVSNTNQGTIQDIRTKGKINVSIIDAETLKPIEQGNATLQGAEYGLFARENIMHGDGSNTVLYEADELVTKDIIENYSLTFGKEGEYLELGKYYVMQITPSKGYKKDETKYNVDLLYINENTPIVEQNITVKQQVKKQGFNLINVGEDGTDTELNVILNSGFKIYLISDLQGVKNGEITPNENGNYQTSSFIGYDFSNEQTALNYSNNFEGDNIPEIFTDNKGFLQSPELAYGKYVIVESTVPEDYLPINPFIVDIVEDNRTPQTWRVMLNRDIVARISVIKKDETSGQPVLKPNASYRIYNITQGSYVEQPVVYPPPKTIVGTQENPFKTNSEGKFTTPATLGQGKYRLEEISAPEGYVLAGNEGNSNNNIYTSTPKSSVEFELSTKSAIKMDPNTGEAYVLVEQYNDRQVGSLTINVVGDILTTTTKNENGYEFEYTKLPIENAKFEIYANADILAPDNSGTILYKQYEKVSVGQTDADGNAFIDNLPLGKYYIQEITSGNGFALNTTIEEFEITYDKKAVAVTYKNEEYINERQKVKIIINNTDKQTGKPVTGGIFGLYLKEELNYKNGTIPANELIQTGEANENGIITFENNLPLAKYYLKEIKAPNGYATNQTEIEIDATYETDQRALITKTIDFTNTQTCVKIVAKDVETGKTLTGMGFSLKDNQGNEITNWVSEGDGEFFVYALEEGKTYTIVENNVKSGYMQEIYIDNDTSDPNELIKTKIENEQITFTLNDTASIQSVTLKNKAKVSNINIILHGEVLKGIAETENGNQDFVYELDTIAGGQFEIYAKENIIHPDGTTGTIIPAGEKIATLETEKTGKLITKIDENIISSKTEEIKLLLERGIPLGKYEIKQTKSIQGYYRNPDNCTMELDITSKNTTNETQHEEILFKNERQKINFTGINTIDSEDKSPLAGGEYELYVKDNIIINGEILIAKDTFIEKSISGENGIAQFKADLSLGNYYIIQTIPPKKYIKNDEHIQIEATQAEETQSTINVSKEKANQKTAVAINKFEIGKTDNIAGTKFQITDEEGNIIENWVTNNNTSLVKGLETNKKYILFEAQPAPGYTTAQPIHFSLDDYGIVQTDSNNLLENTVIQAIVMKDDITKLEVSVIDKKTKEPIIGANMQIINKNTKEIAKNWITDENTHYIEKLPIGDYILVQASAPTEKGYVKADNIEFAIKDTNDIHKIEMENDITKLETYLIDGQTKELLPGGKLEIRNSDNEVIQTIEDTSKKFYIEQLPVGKYTIVEATTPGGYKTSEIINFEIKETSQIYSIGVINNRLPFDFKIDKWVSGIKVSGENRPGNTLETKDKVLKIDIASKKIKTEKIKVNYKIKVSNIGEVEGTVGKVIDEIPGGFEFITSENPVYWNIEGQHLICTSYENKTIKPNETFELEVTLTWINADNNFGTRTNIAKLENCTNPYGFTDINNNNNKSEAPAILSIKTGIENVLLKHATLIVATELLVISVFIIIEIKIYRNQKLKKKE